MLKVSVDLVQQTRYNKVYITAYAPNLLKERLKLGRLSFDMSERWLKRGIINLFSPSIFKMFLSYHLGGWGHKPLYKLCCSAFQPSFTHIKRQTPKL